MIGSAGADKKYGPRRLVRCGVRPFNLAFRWAETMRLSDISAQLEIAGDVSSFTVYLAAPDEDGTDVDLASVGRIEIDLEEGVARFYPVSSTTDDDSIEPEPSLGIVLSQLPMDAISNNDLRLLVEVPLIRDDRDSAQVSLEEIADLRIGKGSEEVWFLVRPANEFASGLLPT
jgi:hypothetical protein